MLVVKHGVEDGHIKGGGSRASGWLKDLEGVREGVCVKNDYWFKPNLFWRVCHGEILSFRISHLFDICVDNSIFVIEMGRLGCGLRVRGGGGGNSLCGR